MTLCPRCPHSQIRHEQGGCHNCPCNFVIKQAKWRMTEVTIVGEPDYVYQAIWRPVA